MNIVQSPSPNHNARRPGAAVDILLMHYTVLDGPASLRVLIDPEKQVSAHYLVMTDGAVHQLVDEARRAWHAGVSHWDGDADVNGRSVGIEIVNNGNESGAFEPYPEVQIDAVIALSLEILARHPIPPERVLGHSDVAPDRKVDPGDLFPWARLAAAGVGIWPDAPDPRAAANAEPVRAGLTRYGYDPDAERAVAAFQRHFRPRQVDGAADAETAGLLATLLRMTGRAGPAVDAEV